SPALLMARIKGRTSRQLRQEFPRLQRMRSLWTRSYFVSTAGNVSTETVRRYIEERKKRR
ncbi:MAG: IS200/IS605 family transposase, partial [Thermaerobacter sp.]|nr:IS200/IS605 family transposase [Thermaerobacter sp.]